MANTKSNGGHYGWNKGCRHFQRFDLECDNFSSGSSYAQSEYDTHNVINCKIVWFFFHSPWILWIITITVRRNQNELHTTGSTTLPYWEKTFVPDFIHHVTYANIERDYSGNDGNTRSGRHFQSCTELNTALLIGGGGALGPLDWEMHCLNYKQIFN